MLIVKPIQAKSEQEELSLLCSATYNINSFAYRADDDGFIGICQFRFDWEAMIIMLRTAMNFMFRCGIKKSIFENNATTEELLKKSGYRPDENGIYSIDIDKFYNTPCHS